MTPAELKQRALQNLEGIITYLLPNAKRVNNYYEVGSVSGEKGQSLKIHYTGNKKGWYKDFASGGKYQDIIDLWMKVRGVSFVQARNDMARFLGVSLDNNHKLHQPAKTYKKINEEAKKYIESKPAPKNQIMDYLTKDRKLSKEIIELFGVTENTKGTGILFPYYDNKNRLINAKNLDIQRKPDGKKVMYFIESECEPVLFGWQSITDNDRYVVITEGEIDAMSMKQYGHPALSTPHGSQGMEWIENEYENLERFETIYICFDQDDPGEKGALILLDRLGRDRCKILGNLPKKDINECLQNSTPASDIDIYIETAIQFDPEELKKPIEFQTGIIAQIHQTDEQKGARLPWKKTHPFIRMRPKEITLITGADYTGKSVLLNQLCLDFAHQGYRSCIASMEVSGDRTGAGLVRMATCLDRPSAPHIQKALHWMTDKIWIYDVFGQANADNMLKTFEYGYKRYGIDFFVIDSLMMLGFSEKDRDEQVKFLLKLVQFKNKYPVHFFIVAHAVKLKDKSDVADKQDIKGPKELSNMADNVITVWRNKEPIERGPKDDNCDSALYLSKQKYGTWIGKVKLWVHAESRQFLQDEFEGASLYVPSFSVQGDLTP